MRRTRKAGETAPAKRVSELFDDEGDGASRFRRAKDLRAIGFAVQPEPVGQADDDVFPRNIAAEVFLQLGSVIAGLKVRSRSETGLDGLFRSFDLLLKLVETATKGKKRGQLQLGYLRWFGEWNDGEFRLLNNF